ncbi:MAG: SusE domain-containing protein, partial [Flavisolibacter sp.]
GLSSQDVTYILQVDTTGANFSSPAKQEISIANDLSLGFTVKELNAVLAKLNLVENMTHHVEFRLKSSLAGGTVPLYSNVIKMVLTPYLDVAVPIPTNGNLWITGDATGAGWANPLGAPYDVSQKFTKVSNTLYELTLNMPGGGNYKLLQDNGQWGTQYHMLTGGTWNGGSFEKKDSDPGFPGPPSSGTYKITVNFKTGLYTVVKQ